MTKRILIVDDQAAIRNMLMGALSNIEDTEIMEAPDGFIALELIKKHDFDLIISDVMMPGMDGYQLKMAVEHDGFDLEFIFMSGQADPRLLSAIKRKGKFVSKPIDIRNLKSIIMKSLGIVQDIDMIQGNVAYAK